MTYIKLFGLQRSGTNVVKGLLELNFRDVVVLQSILGSKHNPFERDQALLWEPTELDSRYVKLSNEEIEQAKNALRSKRMCAVLTIKSPYAWLVSYYRLRKLKNKNYMKWSPAYIKKALPIWIKANNGWLVDLENEFADRLVINFYDKSSNDASSLLNAMEESFSLTRKGEFISLLPKATLRGNDSHFGETIMGNEKFNHNYYAQKRYRRRFTERQKVIVESILEKAPKRLKPYIIW